MSKRDTSSDVPRRIYASTIKRIDKHLQNRPRVFKKSKRKDIKDIKGNFNEFLEVLINTYEELQKAPAIYVYKNEIFHDAQEARGKAILDSVKSKKEVKWPDVYVFVGEDNDES